MVLKRWLAAALTLVLLAGAAAYAAGGGSSDDPIATLSYVRDKFVPKVNENANKAIAAAEPALRSAVGNAKTRLDGIKSQPVTGSSDSLAAAVEYEGYMRALDDGVWLESTRTEITLASGEQVIVDDGGELTLLGGRAKFSGERAGGAVCVSNGMVYYSGLYLALNQRYIVAVEDMTCGAVAEGTAKVAVSGRYQVVPAVEARHTDAALALKSLGLMRGTNNGFELERGATRLEALIMFLRLIGEEEAALAYTGSQPFTDLPVWAGGEPQKYVGYAYSKGYTNGVSATKFGASDEATVEMYVTFLLRALGYSEKSGDFSWETAPADAVKLGVITEYEHRSVVRRTFCRDDMAYLSWWALSAKDKSGTRLSSRLIAAGLFSAGDYTSAPIVRRLG